MSCYRKHHGKAVWTINVRQDELDDLLIFLFLFKSWDWKIGNFTIKIVSQCKSIVADFTKFKKQVVLVDRLRIWKSCFCSLFNILLNQLSNRYSELLRSLRVLLKNVPLLILLVESTKLNLSFWINVVSLVLVLFFHTQESSAISWLIKWTWWTVESRMLGRRSSVQRTNSIFCL